MSTHEHLGEQDLDDQGFGAGRGAAVVVASTSAAAGTADDTVGPRLVAWLRGLGYECPDAIVVPDGPPVGTALDRLLVEPTADDRPRVVVTSGGTGLNPDDRTPDIAAAYLERHAPGIMHALWAYGLQKTPTAAMSRGVAGVRGRTFLVTLPGSSGGAKDGMAVLEPLLPLIQSQIEDA